MINKTSKSGSKVTISNSSTTNIISNILTPVDQIPKSLQGLRANPGGAISYLPEGKYDCSSESEPGEPKVNPEKFHLTNLNTNNKRGFELAGLYH